MRRDTALLTAGVGAAFFGARTLFRMSRRMDFAGRSVVITGGRGLGLELARQYAREGARLSLLARSEDELERARLDLERTGAEVFAIPCDVRDRSSVRTAIGTILGRYGAIDVLVNNAGVIQVGPVEHMGLEEFEEAMAVHMWGPLYTMLEVIPHMRKRGGGRIVNVSSIGGKVAVPHLVPYSASKFALVGLSDGMRAELARDGVLVSTVCPGLVRTGSHVNAYFKGRHEREFAWFSIGNAFPLLSVSSQAAARRIVAASRYGEPRVILGLPAKLAHALDALLPSVSAAGAALVARLLPQPDGAGGEELRIGWDSRPKAARPFTSLSDKAIPVNNEANGHRP